MVNPYRGEVAIEIDGKCRTMKLTLGALAELENGLESEGLVDLVARFETGAFRSRDVLALLVAGLRGGGWEVRVEELMRSDIAGGPVAAAQAAALLLVRAFSLPEPTGDPE